MVARTIVVSLGILGYGSRSAISSTAFIIALLLSGFLVFENMTTTSDIVLSSISHINCTCIFFTLIISFLHNMLAGVGGARSGGRRTKAEEALECMESMGMQSDSRMLFVLLMLLLLISAASNLTDYEHFSTSQCIIAAQTFALSSKILLYCALVRCTKSQFESLNKCLQSAETRRERTQVSQLKEISVIYDKVLKIISLLNESFSSLLSFAFGEYKR
jgi:hypothetical protein